MQYQCQCAHRWAFSAWGGSLSERADDLAPLTGHEVVVRVTHCGICHSDLHLQAGGFELGGSKRSSFERAGIALPVTMGHEIAGEVCATGPEVTHVAVGERVVVYPWIGCGACATCAAGDDHLCAKGPRNLGFQWPGGYADLVRVPHAKYLVPLGTLDPARAATFACAGITALSAIGKLPAVGGDDVVAVIGCGGVGMTAVALLGSQVKARIVAIDPDPAKRAAALTHGAALAFDPNEPEAWKTINKACAFNVSAAIDFVGSEASAALAVNLVRRGGRVVMVGLFGGELRMPLPNFALKSLAIVGSYVGSLHDLQRLVALAQHTALPEIPLDRRPLAEVNQALADLAQGRVLGRVVLEPR